MPPTSRSTSQTSPLPGQPAGDHSKRSRADRTPVIVPDATPTPNAKRPIIVDRPSPKDLFGAGTSTEQEVTIDLRDATELARQLELEAENDARLAELTAAAQRKSRRGKQAAHKPGVVDCAARKILSRSVRAAKANDRVYVVHLVEDEQVYSYSAGLVQKVTGSDIHVLLLPTIDSPAATLLPDAASSSTSLPPKTITTQAIWIFTQEAWAREAMVSLNDLIIFQV